MDREKMRLIDANVEKAKVDVIINSLVFGDEDEEMLAFMNTLRQLLHMAFDEAPTVDAEPVRHGRCVRDSEGQRLCSVCNEHEVGMTYYKYCPNCGAKMDLQPPEETKKGEFPC